MPNRVVDILENRDLIRGEWRFGARWYELTHDRLISPIKESNKAWRYKREEERAKALAETSKRIRDRYSKLKIMLPIIATTRTIRTISIANGYSFLKQWGSTNLTGNGQLSNPDGIAVDSSGNVYVTDSNHLAQIVLGL
jgi:DNA-binding beta-propeller fold protein YncE